VIVEEARLTVHVQSRASRTGIVGLEGSVVRIRVTAPPVGGAANEAVRDLLAEALGCPRSAVRIIRGHAARSKLVGVYGISVTTVLSRLAGAGAARRAE
jgi:uncharacterized protein (TIGR00251 family)